MTAKKVPKHTGVPTFFKVACSEANRGGTKTYSEAAWHLAIHVDSAQAPDDADLDEWEDVYLKRLTDACAKSNERPNLGMVRAAADGTDLEKSRYKVP